MIIELKKFGTTLTSRQAGKEAFNAFQYMLKTLSEDEEITVDFDGINTFSPSWGDEFLSQLYYAYKTRLLLKTTTNLSVTSTISILEETNKIKFNIKN